MSQDPKQALALDEPQLSGRSPGELLLSRIAIAKPSSRAPSLGRALVVHDCDAVEFSTGTI
jgi:hypothetical protein